MHSQAGFPIKVGGTYTARCRGRSGSLVSLIRVGGLVPALAIVAMLHTDACCQALLTRLYEADGAVHSMLKDGSTLYVGGDFTKLWARTGGGAVASATSRDVYTSFPMVTGSVSAVVSDGAGGWFIGGSFTAVGGVARQRLAHILSTGALDSWSPSCNGQVSALCLAGNVLYAGGSFTVVDGSTRNRLAAFDVGSGALTAWNPNSSSHVNCMAVIGNIVCVGGAFTTLGGEGRSYLGAVDAQTGAVTSWNPVSDGVVHSMVSTAAGNLVVGGYFGVIGGENRNCLAGFATNDDHALAFNPNPDGPVYAMARNGDILYFGGSFLTVNGQTRVRVAALNLSPGTLRSWSPSVNNGTVYSLAVSGGIVQVGGAFSSITSQGSSLTNSVTNLARFLESDGTWTGGWIDPDGPVYALQVTGSYVYVGGTLNRIGPVPRSRIAAIDLSTGRPTTWNPAAANGIVWAMAKSGNVLYVGGYFSSLGSSTRSYVGAIDVSTGAATGWNPGADQPVWCMAVGGTSLYVGGQFGVISGQARNRIASFELSSGALRAWNPNANNIVRKLLGSSTEVFVGGDFTVIGGAARVGIAAIDPNSGAATTWNPAANGGVYALASTGTTLYLGGSFTQVGGQPRQRLAAVDAASGALSSWNPGANNTVISLVPSGGSIFASGVFTTCGGQARSRMARLDALSGGATAWSGGFNDNVEVMAGDGTCIYAGGWFTTSSAGARSYLLALTDNIAPAVPTTIAQLGRTTAGFIWTDPGDDGSLAGAGAYYEVRKWDDLIQTESDWASATIMGSGQPGMPGTQHCLALADLPSCSPIYFAVRVQDVAGNWSPVGNSAGGLTRCSGFVEVNCQEQAFTTGPQAAWSEIDLSRPSPNPIRSSTRIDFVVPGGEVAQVVELGVYDLAGRRVRTLVRGSQRPGPVSVEWDRTMDRGGQVAPGCYFVRLRVGGQARSRVIQVL